MSLRKLGGRANVKVDKFRMQYLYLYQAKLVILRMHTCTQVGMLNYYTFIKL